MRKLASFAACLVWLVIVPLLLASPAQGHGDGSSAAVGRNPPDSYPYLNWMDDGTDYDAYIDQAKLWWNDADRVVIGRTTLDSKADACQHHLPRVLFALPSHMGVVDAANS